MKSSRGGLILWILSVVSLTGVMFYRWCASSVSLSLSLQGLPIAPTNAIHSSNSGSNHSEYSQLVLWSTDFHISPIADVKALLQPLGVRVIDKSLSGHCHLTRTCAREEEDLHVLSRENGLHLSPCANDLRRRFYEHYRKDEEFLKVDAILCQHAASLCELYLPFNKPLIVIASTRYEVGRHEPARWRRWNANLERIAQHRGNVVAANNAYDSEYIKYFTSIPRVQVLPNLCDYVKAVYAYDERLTDKPVLLAPARGVSESLQRDLFLALSAYNERLPTRMLRGRVDIVRPVRIAPIRSLYPQHFEYHELAAHPAIVFVPYQVSIMSLFEYYRMQIPLFVPSLRLLVQWELQYHLLNERTWMSVFGRPVRQSPLPRHARSNCSLFSDPNDDFTAAALKDWLALSDFYQWPHITQFDSLEELFALLRPSEERTQRLRSTSHAMGLFNEQEKVRIRAQWEEILQRVRDVKSEKAIRLKEEALPESINEVLRRDYGIELEENCEGEREI